MKFHFSPVRLPVQHVQQQATGDCLAACAVMAFAYLGLPFDYQKFSRLLRVRPQFGTPFFNIRELGKLGVTVAYQQRQLTDLYTWLAQGLPCIVGIQTGELPYWRHTNVQHAVVVVGMDSDWIYLNDPAFFNAPVQVALGDFDLAWLEQDEFYAVIT
ncbi:MAG: papain-like cysteine protease family protein [Caldilineaceae bacterium]